MTTYLYIFYIKYKLVCIRAKNNLSRCRLILLKAKKSISFNIYIYKMVSYRLGIDIAFIIQVYDYK